jgi:hypothetical protein
MSQIAKQNRVCAAEIDQTLILAGDEAWFHLSGYVNSHNNECNSALIQC